jgi:hypothetical protein
MRLELVFLRKIYTSHRPAFQSVFTPRSKNLELQKNILFPKEQAVTLI